MKELSTDLPLDGNLKPLKDSDGTMSGLEISTNKARVKTLEVIGEAKGQEPTAPDGFATKQYVDDNAGGGSDFYWILHAGFNYSSTAPTKVYVPLNGYIIESSGYSSRNEYQVVIVPYDGYLQKVIARSEQNCGSVTVGLHISADNTEAPASTASHTVTVDMSTDDISTTFAFGESASLSAGEVIAISFTPTNDSNDTNLTAVFILDGST